MHTLLWVKDAPEIGKNTDEEITEFIDKYQTCGIPEDDEELAQLVKRLQMHVHCKTCKRNGKWRFNFPHPSSDKTVIIFHIHRVIRP